MDNEIGLVFGKLIKGQALCLVNGHDWENVSLKPFEWDGEEPMFLYHCLNCEETKVDL